MTKKPEPLNQPTPAGQLIVADNTQLKHHSLFNTVCPDNTVQCVYLDPPYNTGRKFKNYSDRATRQQWEQQFRDSTQVAHKKLCDTGVLWVQLDETMLPVARQVLDDQFGANNYVTTIVWQRKQKQSFLGLVSKMVDHILVYAKNREQTTPLVDTVAPTPRRTPLAQRGANTKTLVFPPNTVTFGTETAVFEPTNMSTPGLNVTLEQTVVVKNSTNTTPLVLTLPSRWDQTRIDTLINVGTKFWVPKTPFRPSAITTGTTRTISNLWTPQTGVPTNEDAQTHLQKLFGTKVFDTPKPEGLLAKIVEATTQPGDTVLDLYAGSGTTGTVAHKLGRNWVLVEHNPQTTQLVLQRVLKVVNNQDPYGVTTTQHDGEGLPDRLRARTAKEFLKWVTQLPDAHEFDQQILDYAYNQVVATQKRVTQWSGGGTVTAHGLAGGCRTYGQGVPLGGVATRCGCDIGTPEPRNRVV